MPNIRTRLTRLLTSRWWKAADISKTPSLLRKQRKPKLMSRSTPSGQLPLPRNSVLGEPPHLKGVEDNAVSDFVSPRNSGSHVEKRTVQQTTRHDEVAKGRGTDVKRDIRDPKRFDSKRPGQSVPKSALDKRLTSKFNVPRWANSAITTAPKDLDKVLEIPFNARDEEIDAALGRLERMWSVEEIKIWGPASGLSEDMLLKRRDYVLRKANIAHFYLLAERMEDSVEPKKSYSHFDGFEPSNDCCVPDSDGVPCRLSIICKTHSLEAKRAAAGGRLEFDRRLAESQREIMELEWRMCYSLIHTAMLKCYARC